MSSEVPLPMTRFGLKPERSQVTLVITSTGFVAIRKMPLKPESVTGSTIDLKMAVFRASKSMRLSPGFCATPAQMVTMSASLQSA